MLIIRKIPRILVKKSIQKQFTHSICSCGVLRFDKPCLFYSESGNRNGTFKRDLREPADILQNCKLAHTAKGNHSIWEGASEPLCAAEIHWRSQGRTTGT